MKDGFVLGIVLTVALGFHHLERSSNASAGSAFDIAITVSPSTIVLGYDKGDRVTVHTDIPLAQVDRASVTMNGITPLFVKADNCGDLVAKFDQASVEALVEPPSATLTLTGLTIDGAPFSGSDDVRVIDDPSPEDW